MIIVGGGKVGSNLAKILIAHKHQVAVIEADED
ncbi:MAG TPA: NAD-binding protein, partial [Caldisericia bacterium]|nr:NAD-binding protein [Caldisericia bacterium]